MSDLVRAGATATRDHMGHAEPAALASWFSIGGGCS